MNAKRSKKLILLAGVLCAACLVTLALLAIEQEKENIRTSGEVILEIPTDSVTALSWSLDQKPALSFHRDGDHWQYDDDEAFPVDDDRIQNMLEPFSSFTAAFIIEDPAALSDYGLDEPSAVIQLTADQEVYEIELGDFSAMDAQRYGSIGDGNVYLMTRDPYPEFDAALSDLIRHDRIPSFDHVESLELQGDVSLSVQRLEEGGPSLREEDRFFTQHNGAEVPLDNALVENFLQDLSWTTLYHYVTYHATPEELEAYGLDEPQLTVSVSYSAEEDDTLQTFTLALSREIAESSEETEEDEEEIIAYARVNESPIVYQLSGEDYKALTACSYNDLRHHEVLPVSFDRIAQLDVALEHNNYTLSLEEAGEENTLLYLGTEFDSTDVQNALTALTAKEFTDTDHPGQTELTLTLTLRDEAGTKLPIALNRYDGAQCLAVVGGEPFALVDRSQVVALTEAIHAIVLSTQPVQTLS